MEKEYYPREFFTGKTILVTGATGFLGKLFVEKILRVQPNLKKLYLLLRASNTHLATQRLHTEVIGKELFKVQREKWGSDYDSFISKKVIAVAGDVSQEMLGVTDLKSEEMMDEINIIVHVAANTKFNDRYDTMMATNTTGTLNVLNFAKNCHKLQICLHVSTAYVCRELEEVEVVTEEPVFMGKSLKGSLAIDIDLEKKLIQQKLSQLQQHHANQQTIDSVMGNFGLQRANVHGWSNTYVFTKAMGEMLVLNMKDKLPLIITRPTLITATHSEPFAGWLEKVSTIDYVIYAYGTGILKSFVGHPETVLDTIPADMVINSMVMALVAYSKKFMIYHVGSSLRNPFKVSDLQDVMYWYFTNNPFVHTNGKMVVVHQKLQLYSSSMDDLLNKEPKLKTLIIDLYRPLFLFKGIFDDQNVEKLLMEARGAAVEEEGVINNNFDPKYINWNDYMINVHIPCLMNYYLQKNKHRPIVESKL